MFNYPIFGKETSRLMRKQSAHAKPKAQISFTVIAKLINAFVFATRTVQSHYFLKPKFPASSHLLCLCSSVCVGPVRKPHCWFSHNMAQIYALNFDSSYCVVKLLSAQASQAPITLCRSQCLEYAIYVKSSPIFSMWFSAKFRCFNLVNVFKF